MASDNTDSDYSVKSEDSDVCSLPEYDMEEEDGDLEVTSNNSEESLDSFDLADTDEPIAEEEWLKEYEKEQKENEKLERMLEKRLNGRTPVDSWYVAIKSDFGCTVSRIKFLCRIFPFQRCSCGNCDRQLLQNLSECYCCKELEGCEQALNSDLVQRDIQPYLTLQCITAHPGFKPVCSEGFAPLSIDEVPGDAFRNNRRTV